MMMPMMMTAMLMLMYNVKYQIQNKSIRPPASARWIHETTYCIWASGSIVLAYHPSVAPIRTVEGYEGLSLVCVRCARRPVCIAKCDCAESTHDTEVAVENGKLGLSGGVCRSWLSNGFVASAAITCFSSVLQRATAQSYLVNWIIRRQRNSILWQVVSAANHFRVWSDDASDLWLMIIAIVTLNCFQTGCFWSQV